MGTVFSQISASLSCHEVEGESVVTVVVGDVIVKDVRPEALRESGIAGEGGVAVEPGSGIGIRGDAMIGVMKAVVAVIEID